MINKPNLPKLNFAEYEPSKYDFYSDIEKNTSLDIHSKYYDTNDFNEMTKDLNPKKSFSLLHTYKHIFPNWKWWKTRMYHQEPQF